MSIVAVRSTCNSREHVRLLHLYSPRRRRIRRRSLLSRLLDQNLKARAPKRPLSTRLLRSSKSLKSVSLPYLPSSRATIFTMDLPCRLDSRHARSFRRVIETVDRIYEKTGRKSDARDERRAFSRRESPRERRRSLRETRADIRSRWLRIKRSRIRPDVQRAY